MRSSEESSEPDSYARFLTRSQKRSRECLNLRLEDCSDLSIRSFKATDASDLGRMLQEIWPYGTTETEVAYWKGRYDLYLALERSSLVLVAEIAHRPLGIVVARDPFLGDGGFGNPEYLEKIQDALGMTEQGRRVLRLFSDERWADACLLVDSDEPFACEITLFATDVSVRGKGIGGRLLSTLFDALAALGVEGVYLFTDTGCDWDFYERHRFTRRAERDFANGRDGASYTNFLFDKALVKDALED